MPVDTTQLRVIAARVKRQTTNPDVLELCEAALAQSSGCLACDMRRAARTASQRKWRDKKSGASNG